MARQLDLITAPDPRGRRRPFAHAVQGQDRRFLKWAREERAGGMALMVIHK
jgi:hypothetical protein